MPDPHSLDSLPNHVERHVDLIIEVLQRAHGVHLGITSGPADRHTPSVNVTIELPEEHACPPPSEEPAHRARDIPRNCRVIVVPNRIAVGIMRFGVSTSSALVIEKRKELPFLFGHHAEYSPAAVVFNLRRLCTDSPGSLLKKVAAAPRGGRVMPKNAVSGAVHRVFQQTAKRTQITSGRDGRRPRRLRASA